MLARNEYNCLGETDASGIWFYPHETRPLKGQGEQIHVLPRPPLLIAEGYFRYASAVCALPDLNYVRWYFAVLQAVFWHEDAQGEESHGARSMGPADELACGVGRDLAGAGPHSWLLDDSPACFRCGERRGFRFERRGDLVSLFPGYRLKAVLVLRALCVPPANTRRVHAEPVHGRRPAWRPAHGGLRSALAKRLSSWDVHDSGLPTGSDLCWPAPGGSSARAVEPCGARSVRQRVRP